MEVSHLPPQRFSQLISKQSPCVLALATIAFAEIQESRSINLNKMKAKKEVDHSNMDVIDLD